MNQFLALTNRLQSEFVNQAPDESHLKTGLSTFIGNYPLKDTDEACKSFLSDLSHLVRKLHTFPRGSRPGLDDLVTALVPLHAKRVLDRNLVLMLFRDVPPESMVNQFREMAASGDEYARTALDIIEARNEFDYFKLADYIPVNWFDLHKAQFDDFYGQHRSAMLDYMSQQMLGLPFSDALEEQLNEKLSSKFGLEPDEMKQANNDMILQSAKMEYFLYLFGGVLEKDEKGSHIIPSPFLARFMAISPEKANEQLFMN